MYNLQAKEELQFLKRQHTKQPFPDYGRNCTECDREMSFQSYQILARRSGCGCDLVQSSG